MIKSMTGFGRCEIAEGERKFTVEMKSVNHRYLDINIKMPKKLNFFESAIRNFLKTYMERGKVDMFITYEDLTESHMVLKYNEDIAAGYMKYMAQMAEQFDLENDMTVSRLARYPDVFVMEEQTVDALLGRNWEITTVESCTGGAVAARIVNVPGASDVLKEGYITYCDAAKMKLAGVRRETLEAYTAVSRQTAEEMALGGIRASGADVALAVTGLAGPGGGTEERPVGLVYVGCAVHERVTVKELHLKGSRREIRDQAADEALKLALECILRSIP